MSSRQTEITVLHKTTHNLNRALLELKEAENTCSGYWQEGGEGIYPHLQGIITQVKETTDLLVKYREELETEQRSTTMSDMHELPDGSGVTTGEFPLPEDHWLFEDKEDEPPMHFRCGTAQAERKELEDAIRAGVKYAMRVSTNNGKEDYDPDAIVNNAIIGIIGYFTPDGTQNTSDVSFVGDDKDY